MYLDKAKTLEDLKQQYRAWTKKLHPDCGGSDEQMKALADMTLYLVEV